MKTLIRTIMIIGFFVIGTLVLSQNSIDNLAPEEQGLRTQAINTCSALFCDRVEVRQFYLNTNGFFLFIFTLHHFLHRMSDGVLTLCPKQDALSVFQFQLQSYVTPYIVSYTSRLITRF